MIKKEGFTMHNEDIIIKGNVRSERKGENIYFFGKLWWCLYNTHKKGSNHDGIDMETKRALMSIELEEISFKDFTNIYNLIINLEKSFNFDCYDTIKVPGISITINENMSYKYFEKALRQLFAIVFAETPKRRNIKKR